MSVRKGICLSTVPRDKLRESLARIVLHQPTEDELDAFVGTGTLDDRRCANTLCDWNLQRGQASFCTRCWRGIEACRELGAKAGDLSFARLGFGVEAAMAALAHVHGLRHDARAHAGAVGLLSALGFTEADLATIGNPGAARAQPPTPGVDPA